MTKKTYLRPGAQYGVENRLTIDDTELTFFIGIMLRVLAEEIGGQKNLRYSKTLIEKNIYVIICIMNAECR